MARVSQGRPGKFVDNDDVDFCMIDLHDLKRTANCIFPRDCCGRLDDIAFAAPLAPNPDVDCFHTPCDAGNPRPNALPWRRWPIGRNVVLPDPESKTRSR